LEAILALQKECFLPVAVMYNDYNLQSLVQTIDSIRKEYFEGTIILKGVIDGKIIASVRGTIKQHAVYIGKLIVAKNYRNNNFGQLMMKAIEDYFDNCKRYELFTGHRSEKNLYLYKKLGYKEFTREIISENHILVFLRKTV
jgi:GNAT superfamily N-acetyltransferase